MLSACMALSNILKARPFRHTTISCWSEHCLYAVNSIRKPDTSEVAGDEGGGASEATVQIAQPNNVNL